ncbi:hypothetical protein [Aeromonas caviae]|uniref:hypothetical protein n=1 Tax=Aeromonas caviae TaxID=648 RepID=UPI002B47C08E|nr:hypothetical protein [Aeromonas caviae]
MIIANGGHTAQGEALPKNSHLLAESRRPQQAQFDLLAFHHVHTELAGLAEPISRHTFALLYVLQGGSAACAMAVAPIAIECKAVELAPLNEAK